MKKIGKVIIGIGISGSIMTSAAAAAIIWSGDSSEKLVAKTQFDLKPIILKVKETKIPIGFYSISEAPLEIADFIKKRFLSEGEDIESLSGVPNIKDGIITTTITYKTLAGQIKTKTFVFGGWHKAPSIDQRNTKLLAEFAAVLPRMPETPIEEQYKQEFQTLKKVRKRILDRIYTYSIPTIEYLKPLIDEFQILIDQFNRGIQDSWTLEERLESIAIEPEYISTQGQTVTPGFPTYNAPSLTRAAKEQLEKYVQEKLLVKNLAHVYNEKLKEADLAAMIAITSANLLKYINQLKAIIIPTKVVFKDMATIRYFNSYTLPTNIEDLTIEQVKEEIVKAKAAKTDNNAYNRDINAKHKYKLLVDKLLEEQKDHLKKIIIEPEYVSIQGQRLTLAYPIYERPALKDATPQQLEQFIEEKVAVQKAAHIYNDKLKKADLYASENLLKYVNQLKAIIVPTKVVFSGITTSLTFNVYTVPSDIDDLTLEQIKKEIIKAKAAKTQNIAYNKDINAKYKLSADKLLQEQKNHLTSIIIEHEYISTQGQIMTPGYPNYTGHLLMGATLQEVEQYIRDKLAIQRLANSYNTKLKEADLVAKNLMISKARWKLKIPVLPLLGNKDPVEYGILADFRVSIISKIDDNSINTEETLNIENDKYKILVLNFNSKQSYGLIPESISDSGELMQEFYYDNTNLEKFKVAFSNVEGISTITSSDADGVANSIKTLPNGFLLPSTITNLGHFGKSLISLPQRFTLPTAITSLGSFGFRLTSLSQNFTFKGSCISNLGSFGYSLTSLPQDFSFGTGTTITRLGRFGQFLTSLSKNFTFEGTIISHLDYFGFSLKSLSKNFTFHGTSITYLSHFGYHLKSLPQNFTLQNTNISDLGLFGHSLISLSKNFTLQGTAATNLGSFGYSLKSIPQNFTLPVGVAYLGQFGKHLTSLPSDFTLRGTRVKSLGSFGHSLKSLPQNFSLPITITNMGNFGHHLTSLLSSQHLLQLDGVEITMDWIAYIKDIKNIGKWYIATKVGQRYKDSLN